MHKRNGIEMSSSPPRSLDSGLRHHSYCRKQKSLGVLCSNFVSLYDRDDVELVGLDYAARRLGVERRRIYDIVNVLESVGVLARKAKNKYSWIGFSGIPKALKELRDEGLRAISGCDGPCDKEVLEDEDEDIEGQNHDDGDEKLSKIAGASIESSFSKARSATDNRKEKSLGLLTRNFVKLFLMSDADTISLDEAARLLLGDMSDLSHMRNFNAAKVRRLYDIANVLSSMNLIEKIQVEARKPAFRWLGTKGKLKTDNTVMVSLPLIDKQLSKRAFGTEITNVETKRSRLSYTISKKSSKAQLRNQDLKECNLTAQKQLNMKNGFVFGPFCPAGVTKVDDHFEESGGRSSQDCESLACSLRPQYHNQALSELFSHYMEAWKSWYAELGQGGNLQQPYDM
ncbi:E2F transcription factor-like E2FE isoform X1 [Canna indica]|uniref:E2F transcription factor-like E2FE isoform X1 n=1 Tax=Canna indica TaxID=4628 RepID=A0AAQ3JP22_9LILI|nr:E2F transcription factor-like E2FE isoform X1 [Canna indica]